MSEQNSHFEYMVIAVVGGGLLIAGALYGIYLFWPYLVFYVLPFAIGSLIVGAALRMAVSWEKNGLTSYKGLAVAFPVLLVFVMVAFFVNSGRSVVRDENGNITGQYLDWPKVSQAFNAERSSTYAGAPFESLRAKARERVIFDRQEIGWIALWSLFLGGPLFFGFLSLGDEDRDNRVLREKIAEASRFEREDLLKKERGVDALIAKAARSANEKLAVIERRNAALEAENQVLKARVEFSSEVAKPSEARRSSGVLDSDIL